MWGRTGHAKHEALSVKVETLVGADGAPVCVRCSIASGPWTRLRGLLGRSGLPPGEGMLFRKTGSVHTMFMRFPIDVVFLDDELRVLSVRESVPAWRTAVERGARVTLELAAGEAHRVGIEPGQQLSLATPSGS